MASGTALARYEIAEKCERRRWIGDDDGHATNRNMTISEQQQNTFLDHRYTLYMITLLMLKSKVGLAHLAL